ncbi:MAG: hypothetical protein AAF609_17140 [Cyanobacteria bacterium P01_C01_bin.120]
MQPPAIETIATSSVPVRSSSPTVSDTGADSTSNWQCLPLHKLTNFELVDHQFASLQVGFESAIALRPSNPRFQIDESSLILMAFYHKAGIKIHLGQAVAAIDMGFISVEPLVISALDADGHCLSIIKTAELPASPKPLPGDTTQRCSQDVMLDTHGAKTLRIDSVAPFVLTRFWINQAGAATVA